MLIEYREVPTRKETHRMLTLLGRYVLLIPEDRFHMHGWFSTATGEKVLQPPHVQQCNTSACVGGWATTIKEFQDAGLYLTEGWNLADRKQPGAARPRLVCNFFGITADEADDIFFSYDMTPKQKSEQILAIAETYR